MSIRSRLVILCLVVSLLPAIPLSLLVKTLLEKSFNLGLSSQIEQALQNGIAVSRDHLELIHRAFEEDVAAIVTARETPVPDSAAVAGTLAATPKPFRRIDGVLMAPVAVSGGGDIEPYLRDPDLLPGLRSVVGDARIVPRSGTGSAEGAVSFYTTGDRAVHLAVWHSPGGDMLFYGKIDPEFLERTSQLLSGLQLFAQLRLTQPGLSRSFFYPFIVIYGVILLLSLALALLMSERLAQPVRRLSAGVREVAHGDWSCRVDAQSGGEVGQLIDAFNWMVTRLEQQHRRLIDMEKMATWREMARHLAHEVKNPLLPIRLTVQEIKDQYRGDDLEYRTLVEESVRVVEDELSHLQRLVKEFSTFAKMPDLSLSVGSFEELAADVLKLYPKITASINADPDMAEFTFDRDQMRRVLINLLDNAVSVLEGRDEPRIAIAIMRRDDDAVVTFADNGPGIPPDALDLIFEPYYTKRSGGSGIGLAIVKSIVLLHGGSIRAENRENSGAVFIITVPMTKSIEAPDGGDRSEQR
jgi:nitrogen fixation/metabolism regulation signal transduction histidine kinase